MSLTTWFRDYVYIPLGGSRPDLSTKTKKNTACAAININIEEGNRKHGDFAQTTTQYESQQGRSYEFSSCSRSSHKLEICGSPDVESSPYKKTPDLSSDQENRGKQIIVERRRKVITIRNVFVVFMLCAIWHGANWTYMVWGVYHVVLFVPLILIGRKRETRDESGESRVERCLEDFAHVCFGNDRIGYI